MPGVAVVNSGNYDLQIATGFLVDAFVLDDALKGVLDNTDYVLDGTTEFADVMDSVTNINVRRGRRDVGDQFSAGTMTFTIQDVDGIFNPFDQNSPFFDTPIQAWACTIARSKTNPLRRPRRARILV
jgi:hypothetical protein